MRFSGTWHPEGVAREYGRRRPAVGDLVAYDYRAWEVMDVTVRDFADGDQEHASGYRPQYRDEMRPYSVTLRRVHGAHHDRENSRQEIGLGIRAFTYGGFDRYQNGRVPLCSCHNQPWPCLEADQQTQAEKELKAAERELRVLPGCCPACEEPVTSRQRCITFGGPNVRNPLAEGPTFHLRRACYGAAARYEEAWVAAEPGRPRSLLTLSCSGTVIVHDDGTAECFGADGSDCPSTYAKHRSHMACYVQSHGCGRGCTPSGHPGTRQSGRPADPRAITRIADRKDQS